MKNIDFLIAAYSFIWIAIGYYFYFSGKKIKDLEKRIKRIEEDK